MNKEQFINELKKINIELSNEILNSLSIYCEELLEYNKTTNLTAIRDEAGVYLKHFYDSLTIYNLIKKSSKIIDIGTGAGFPGMVLAISRPDLDVYLLDSNNKKIKFLEYLKDKLQLNNVTIIYNRAENFANNHREEFDYIVSRAVAQLRVLLELGIPMLKINGKFISMKGILDKEFDEALDTIEILNSNVIERNKFLLPIENSNRENIIIQKINTTSKEYPRVYDKIIKKPLVKNCKK